MRHHDRAGLGDDFRHAAERVTGTVTCSSTCLKHVTFSTVGTHSTWRTMWVQGTHTSCLHDTHTRSVRVRGASHWVSQPQPLSQQSLRWQSLWKRSHQGRAAFDLTALPVAVVHALCV